ncbi:MAG: substrate-binding domain-containing protein [Actinobacteria bacterium]|nr:substrate-binding domain-containing protein [Actinomycetota bacterium]MSY87978.1 substrate-binding domain-containing protein [Actinomycetota bacterium]
MVAVSGVIAALALTGCSSSSSSSEAAAAPAEPATEIAYLSASSANTWLQASKKEMDAIAAENNMVITEFDAQFKPGEQGKQVQDIIASGKYKAIIISSVDGAGIIPDLQAAIAKGLKVGILNQIVGTKLDTSDPQFDGPSVSVLAAPLRSGERLGKVTLKACEGLNPCNVVYLYGIKGIPLDNALKQGFDSVVSANPAIKVVAEGEGKYLGPDVAQKALADIMQKTKKFDVVIGSDQSMQGAVLALADAGKTAKLIGLGGSQAAVDGIKAGTWFGGVFGAPATEGKLLMNAMVEALKSGKVTGGIDPATAVADEALMTKDNIDKFTAEWAG